MDYKSTDAGSEYELNEDEQRRAKRFRRLIAEDLLVIDQKQSIMSSAEAAVRPRSGAEPCNFMVMPVDVLFEICQYLDPQDLRALSLTTQSLHNILLSRDAKHIWKSSLLGIPDLPECPPDLNEPQYVRLLFSSECYDCGINGGISEYYHRVLYCDKCFQINMIGSDHKYWGREDTGATYIVYFFTSQGGRTWHKRTLDAALSEYQSLMKSTADSRDKFISDAMEAHNMRVQTGVAISKWKQAYEHARQIAQDNLRAEHQKSVEANLLRLGWQEIDFPRHGSPFTEYNSLVGNPEKLTEQAWQTLLPKLEPILESERRMRLTRETIEGGINADFGDFGGVLDTSDMGQVFGDGEEDITAAAGNSYN